MTDSISGNNGIGENVIPLCITPDTKVPTCGTIIHKVQDIIDPEGNNSMPDFLKKSVIPSRLVKSSGIYSPQDFKSKFHEGFEEYVNDNSYVGHFGEYDKVIIQLVSQYIQDKKNIPANDGNNYNEYIEECEELLFQIHSIICKKLGLVPRKSLDEITWERVIAALERRNSIHERQEEISNFIGALDNTDIPLHPQYLYQLILEIGKYVNLRNDDEVKDGHKISTYQMIKICRNIQDYVNSNELDPALFQWQGDLALAFKLDPQAEDIWIQIGRKASEYNKYYSYKKTAT